MNKFEVHMHDWGWLPCGEVHDVWMFDYRIYN